MSTKIHSFNDGPFYFGGAEGGGRDISRYSTVLSSIYAVMLFTVVPILCLMILSPSQLVSASAPR